MMSEDCPGRWPGVAGVVCKTAAASRAATSSLSSIFVAILWNVLACPKLEAGSEPVNYP
jgi:hypothetical protein